MRDDDLIPADLARLADGSIAPRERAALEAKVAASPELQALVAEQRRVLSSINDAAAPAPPALRARIEALRPTRGRRARIALSGALATAAVALALALVLPGGSPAGPSLSEAATLTALPATAPAPREQRDAPTMLDIAIGGIPFPAWADAFGWRAQGSRSDRIDGRDTTTVFYEKSGRRIGYTIVAGDALDVPGSAQAVNRDGLELHTLTSDGRTVITWEREGHTCILSGTDVAVDGMLELATWTAGGTVPY